MKDFIAFLYRGLQHLLRGLIFLPQVVPLALPAKPGIFPWALLWSLHKENRIKPWMGVFLVYITINALVAYVMGSSPGLADTLRSYVAVLNAVLAFGATAFLAPAKARALAKTAKVILGLCLVVAGLQYGAIMPYRITEILQAWIPHFKGGSWGGERGVASLFTEPAFAGSVLQLLSAFAFWKYRLELGRWKIVFLIFLGLLQVMVIKSFVGVMLFGVWIVCWAAMQNLPRALGALLLLAMALLVFIKMEYRPRAMQLLYEVWLTGNFREAGELLVFQSGFRWTGWLAAMRYGLEHPWGCGLGAWREASLQALSANGLNVWPLHLAYQFYGGDHLGFRPTSFVSGLMLETGWTGLALLGVAMTGFLRNIWKDGEAYARALLILCVTVLILVGHLGDPVPWLVLGMLYQGLKKETSLSSELTSDPVHQEGDRISIVMPAYHSEATLPEAIEGVLNQSYPHWELLLILDGSLRCGPKGSSADKGDFLKVWQEHYPDPRIRWIHSTKNRGLVRSRNLGIRLSRGSWVAFCDADDVWLPNKLHRQFSVARSNGGTLWFTGFDYRRDEAGSASPRFKKAMLPARPWPGLLAYTNFVGLSSAVFRREAGHLPYFHEAVEGIIHEDYGFWLRYMRDFKPVLSFAPESLVQIRLRQDSRSSNKIQAIRSHSYWLWNHHSNSTWRRLRWLLGMIGYASWALYKSSGTWRKVPISTTASTS